MNFNQAGNALKSSNAEKGNNYVKKKTVYVRKYKAIP